MKRERLQKLFSEDKEIFQGGMLFPTWICKGKEEIENRNIPQRAAVYLDIPIPCAGLLYYEKEKSLHYCEQQTYQVVTLLEGVGCDYSIEKENWQRLAVLARKGMIDVIHEHRVYLMKDFEEYGIGQITGAKVCRFFEDGVEYETADGEHHGARGYDSVVLSMGYRNYNPLEEQVKAIVPDIYVIGDAIRARRALDATKEAYDVASQI